jgi:hypothetical protein
VGLARGKDGSEQALVLDIATAHLLAKIGLRDGAPLPLSSAAYMSPEEAAGKPPDARADLYSLGVLLYQLLSGRLPFMGGNAEELLQDHREHPPLRLRDAGKRVHPDLEALMAQLLAKDPAHRPSSGDELAVMLRALIPVADIAPVEDGQEAVEDPVTVVALPREDEPQVAPPPLPEPPDPALERAMMGEVGAKRPPTVPGIPKWAPRMLPSWWPVAAGAALVLAVSVVLFARGGKKRSAPRPPPVAAVPALVTAPPAAPAPLAEKEKAEIPPRPRVAPAANPNAKSFERAQKAIWTGQSAVAQAALQGLLAKPDLFKRDRARATKMMGDAFAKNGDKQRAAEWYRKSLQLFDDSAERAKVIKLLQALR